MSKKCTPLWRGAHFQVKSAKNWRVWSTFGRSDVVLRGRRKGLCTLSEVSKPWGFCGISKNDARSGTFEEDLERCIFRGRRSTRDMFTRAVRRSAGRLRGCILEHQIFSFGKMILRDKCSILYDLASLFRGRHNTSETWAGINAKLLPFWRYQVQKLRKSCRVASFLTLSSSKAEEVSQNSFIFKLAGCR